MRLTTEYHGIPFEFSVIHIRVDESGKMPTISGIVLIMRETVVLTGEFCITSDTVPLSQIIVQLKKKAREIMKQHLSEV